MQSIHTELVYRQIRTKRVFLEMELFFVLFAIRVREYEKKKYK